MLLFLLLQSLLFDDVRIVVQSLVKLQLLHLLAVFYFLILGDAVFRELLTEEIVVSELIVHGSLSESTYDGLECRCDGLRVACWLLLGLRGTGTSQCLTLDVRLHPLQMVRCVIQTSESLL